MNPIPFLPRTQVVSNKGTAEPLTCFRGDHTHPPWPGLLQLRAQRLHFHLQLTSFSAGPFLFCLKPWHGPARAALPSAATSILGAFGPSSSIVQRGLMNRPESRLQLLPYPPWVNCLFFGPSGNRDLSPDPRGHSGECGQLGESDKGRHAAHSIHLSGVGARTSLNRAVEG